MAKKMIDPSDSDSVKEYSRTIDGKRIFRMPEGLYKKVGDRYIKQTSKQDSVIHG